MRWLFFIATFAGLAVTLWLLGRTGLQPVAEVMARLGPQGFVAYWVYSIAAAVPLGAAWVTAAPPLAPGRHLAAFTWARLVREGASDFLPFSQLGGLVLGARTLIARGFPGALINASMLVDLTTEMASQVVFTLFGIGGFVLLREHVQGADLLWPILLGTGVLVLLVGGILVAQRWALGFGVAMLSKVGVAGAGVSGIREELARIYADRPRVLTSLACNLAAWVASASGAWVALRLMGIELPLLHVLVIESLIFTLRSVAFAIPGAIGVQEAAYVLLGPMLGLPAEAALALSLAKRARELLLGLPGLLYLHLSERAGASAVRAAPR